MSDGNDMGAGMNSSMNGSMEMKQSGMSSDMSNGPVLVGEETRSWALTGFLIGAVVGTALGLALGDGVISVGILAPMSASSSVVPAFVGAAVFAALGALIGGVLGTRAEAIAEAKIASQDARRMPASSSGWLSHLPIDGTIVLITIMALTLYVIASSAIGSGAPSDQGNRVHWQLKNATRVGGVDDRTTELAVLETAYPGTRPENRAGMAFVVPDDWRMALAATPLIARPMNAALVVADSEANTDGSIAGSTASQVRALRAAGVLGPAAPAGTAATAMGPDAVTSAAEFADGVDSRVTTTVGYQTADVIVVAADAPAIWALPSGAYAARTGTSIVFVTANGLPPATMRTLQRRRGAARLYLLGPLSVISARTEQALSRYGHVTRISGRTPERNAISFAEFQDTATDFGWGHTGRGPRAFANMNSILVSSGRWQDAITAAHLARSTGKSGPLLLTHGKHLPAAVESYLWRVRPAYADTPEEGPYSNVWVVGSFARIPYVAQARADYAEEIEQYMTLGDSALSGFEGLALAWLAFAIASAIWIAYHAGRRVPDIMPMTKAAWVLFALLVGPVAVWWYVASYDRRPTMLMGPKRSPAGLHGDTHEGMSDAGGERSRNASGMIMWQRPVWVQVVSATAMMFSFDMMLMVLVVFMLSYIGFPIVQGGGPLYWIGTSMFLMMVVMYVVALILMLLVFHTPMTMHERQIDSYWRAFLVGAPIMVATMTVESVGMMSTMWWAQMSFLPSMQMPTGDDFTMWATLFMSVAVALIVVLPFNYVLVKRGIKQGTM